MIGKEGIYGNSGVLIMFSLMSVMAHRFSPYNN